MVLPLENTVKINDLIIGDGRLTLFGGPCMAESWEVCMQSAEFLVNLCKELNIQYVFKASYDKANRTSGASVRGPGRKAGLEFLKNIKEKFNVPVVTDVHECFEVEEVAEVADVLQIPAFLCRQTDLLVAAGKTGKCINIKKGQFMAPEDMFGAVEKVRSTNNNNILLTERGSCFGYHNLIVDYRSLITMRSLGVPVVFDATHSVQIPGGLGNASGGKRELASPLACAAAAIGIDVLFAEIHPNPDKALSDGPNSLNFQMARELLTKMVKIHDIKG